MVWLGPGSAVFICIAFYPPSGACATVHQARFQPVQQRGCRTQRAWGGGCIHQHTGVAYITYMRQLRMQSASRADAACIACRCGMHHSCTMDASVTNKDCRVGVGFTVPCQNNGAILVGMAVSCQNNGAILAVNRTEHSLQIHCVSSTAPLTPRTFYLVHKAKRVELSRKERGREGLAQFWDIYGVGHFYSVLYNSMNT
eukprot:1156900-Pelagomonas_calceolata.AAC.9